MFTKRRRTPEQQKHIAGLLRVLAYTTGVGLVCTGLTIRAARAEVGDQSIEIGRQMLEFLGSESPEVHKVTLNGQPMFFGGGATDDSPVAVLERFADHCKTNLAQSPDSWRELVDAKNVPPEALTAANEASNGSIRSGNDREGTVLCFVRSGQSKASLKEALTTFGETGELGAMGDLRYVYAKKTPQGTRVLTAWTVSSFNVKAFELPETGDAPGTDFSELPRPADSQRVLSARIEGTPYGLNVYRSGGAPASVIDQYEKALLPSGWIGVNTQLERHVDRTEGDTLGYVYEKDGVTLTVVSGVQGPKTFSALGLAGVQSADRASLAAPR